MSESDPSGYHESPDTGDDAPSGDAPSAEAGPTLTTDDEAQRDDLPARPGNQAG